MANYPDSATPYPLPPPLAPLPVATGTPMR